MNSKKPKYITICSGKGGVGKTFTAANIANILANEGYNVLLWDANEDFPNLHIMLDVNPPMKLNDYNKVNSFEDLIFKVKDNLDLIINSPMSDRVQKNKLSDFSKIYENINNLNRYDYVIIDSMPGANESVLTSCVVSDLCIVLLTDEPTTIVDSYGLTKLLLPFIEKEKISILVNNVIDNEDFKEIIHKFNITTEKFLKKKFNSLGYVPYDREVRKSIQRQELITETDKLNSVFKNFVKISSKISKITNN